jgi:hypothetical protein
MTDRLHPIAVYMLADHLDSALASGEDICRLKLEPHATPDELRVFVEQVRRLELAIVARVMQARNRTRELPANEPTRLLADLFLGGTATLEDAVAELADATLHDFDTGDSALEYLRERAFVEGDAAALSPYAGLIVGDQFRVVGRIELGPLLDLVSAFLDMLVDHYDLFEDADGPSAEDREFLPDEPRAT